MVQIDGVRRAGLGAATGNLAAQLPLIGEEFPEVAGCQHGTINLELTVPLLVVAPDHRTRPINWNAAFPHGEVFDLLRIQLEAPKGSAAVQAWLYIPHGSPHRRTPYIHEVIAAPIKNLAADVQCRISINRNAVQLPYAFFPAVIVI